MSLILVKDGFVLYVGFIMSKKVYCKDCKHHSQPMLGGTHWCGHPGNMRTIEYDTYYEHVVTTICYDECDEKNKNNDCGRYEFRRNKKVDEFLS